MKSTDGGDTWTDITKNQGLPKGVLGRIGVTVSRRNPERVWAIIEAEEGGVFRSDDGGQTWTRVNDERKLRQRAWYYSHIHADPQKADTVYVLKRRFYRSKDGGAHVQAGPALRTATITTCGSQPNDSSRMIEGNDGGANVSSNGGQTWSTQDNQPTAQFYRVALDNDFPYHVYGAQQDNSDGRDRHARSTAALRQSDWYDVGGGESGWIAPDPDEPEHGLRGLLRRAADAATTIGPARTQRRPSGPTIRWAPAREG